VNRPTLEERMQIRQGLAEVKSIIQAAAHNCYLAGLLQETSPESKRLPDSTLALIDFFVEVAENLDERLAYAERRLEELKEKSNA
jgi:hypothetical protein